MIAALAPIYIAQFAEYKDVLVLENDPRPGMAAADWLKHDNLLACMRRFRPQHNHEDLHGLASEWSKYYFVKLIPPVVVANLVLNWDLTLATDKICVVCDEHGLPRAFKLPDEGRPLNLSSTDPERRFLSLLEQNITPFIDALSQLSGLSASIFWSNAGNFFEWILGAMQKHGIPAAALADGYALLDSKFSQQINRHSGRQKRNPMWQPVKYVNKQGNPMHRERRMCCVRYLLDDMKLCADCPRTTVPKRSLTQNRGATAAAAIVVQG